MKILVMDCSESSQRNIEMGFYCCYSFYCFCISFYFIYFILIFYHLPTQNFLMASHCTWIKSQVLIVTHKALQHLHNPWFWIPFDFTSNTFPEPSLDTPFSLTCFLQSASGLTASLLLQHHFLRHTTPFHLLEPSLFLFLAVLTTW